MKNKALKFLGLLLVGFSFIGTLFFKHYSGEMIAYPFVWYAGFLLIGIAGLLLLFRTSSADAKALETLQQEQLVAIKASSNKFIPDINRCLFKSGSYDREVKDEDLSSIKWVLPHSLSIYLDDTKTETLTQSYIVYHDKALTGEFKFISPLFPVDKTTLEYYVLTKKFILYVNKFDKRKYYFAMVDEAAT